MWDGDSWNASWTAKRLMGQGHLTPMRGGRSPPRLPAGRVPDRVLLPGRGTRTVRCLTTPSVEGDRSWTPTKTWSPRSAACMRRGTPFGPWPRDFTSRNPGWAGCCWDNGLGAELSQCLGTGRSTGGSRTTGTASSSSRSRNTCAVPLVGSRRLIWSSVGTAAGSTRSTARMIAVDAHTRSRRLKLSRIRRRPTPGATEPTRINWCNHRSLRGVRWDRARPAIGPGANRGAGEEIHPPSLRLTGTAARLATREGAGSISVARVVLRGRCRGNPLSQIVGVVPRMSSRSNHSKYSRNSRAQSNPRTNRALGHLQIRIPIMAT